MVTDTTTPTPAGQEEETTPAIQSAVAQSWKVRQSVLRENLAHNKPEDVELFVWCFLHCINHRTPMTRQEFSARIGFDHTTIYKILSGKNRDGGRPIPISGKLRNALQHFKNTEMEKLRGERLPVIDTPTKKKIWTHCDLARESQSPAFILGPSHVGKTWALESYAQEHNHGRTIYVRLQAASGLHGMVKKMAAEIGGIGLKANNATLVASVKKALRPGMLLILDEVHELMHTYRKESFFACLEVLREIYDETHVGMVLCGTQLLFKRIEENRGELEQLLRRGVHKLQLPPSPTTGDVKAILDHVGLEFPKRGDTVVVTLGRRHVTEIPYDALRQLARNEGLKAITERLRYGQKFAHKDGEKITWDHVMRAHVTISLNATQPEDDWS